MAVGVAQGFVRVLCCLGHFYGKNEKKSADTCAGSRLITTIKQ